MLSCGQRTGRNNHNETEQKDTKQPRLFLPHNIPTYFFTFFLLLFYLLPLAYLCELKHHSGNLSQSKWL